VPKIYSETTLVPIDLQRNYPSAQDLQRNYPSPKLIYSDTALVPKI